MVSRTTQATVALNGLLAIASLIGCEASGHPLQGPGAGSGSARELKSAPSSSIPSPAGSAASCTAASCPAGQSCQSGSCRRSCPEGEVYIPATGAEGFWLGKSSLSYAWGKMGDRPAGTGGKADARHRVVLSRPFCMDAHEVTVRGMKDCVGAGVCKPPVKPNRWMTWPDKLDHPVNMADWKSARRYCRFRKKELPSEAQWEWAATGGDGRTYPWGEAEPTCKRADFTSGPIGHPAGDYGCNGGGPSRVGSFPEGDRIWPDGAIHDLAGNVWEWTLDTYRPYTVHPQTDPVTIEPDTVHVVRGGGWNRSASGMRAWFRAGAIVNYRVPGLGFRCVRRLEP